MSIKIQSIGALFVALVIILAINPTIVHNMYGSILGRLFLILIVIFFAINNITLGLLIVLTIITALNQYGSFVEATLPFVEGMEVGTPVTVGEDNTNVTGVQKVLTENSISELKKKKSDETIGIDKEDMKMTMMAKNSNEIPLDPNMNKSAEVNAASSGMLNSASAKLEGFSTFTTLY
jgi:hypothetical protein